MSGHSLNAEATVPLTRKCSRVRHSGVEVSPAWITGIDHCLPTFSAAFDCKAPWRFGPNSGRHGASVSREIGPFSTLSPKVIAGSRSEVSRSQ